MVVAGLHHGQLIKHVETTDSLSKTYRPPLSTPPLACTRAGHESTGASGHSVLQWPLKAAVAMERAALGHSCIVTLRQVWNTERTTCYRPNPLLRTLQLNCFGEVVCQVRVLSKVCSFCLQAFGIVRRKRHTFCKHRMRLTRLHILAMVGGEGLVSYMRYGNHRKAHQFSKESTMMFDVCPLQRDLYSGDCPLFTAKGCSQGSAAMLCRSAGQSQK